MPVITISRQFGSGGDEIAVKICEVLGYQLFDKRMIVEAAKDLGLSEQEIIDHSEENYKIRSFFDRLFNRPVEMPTGRIWVEDATGTRLGDEVRLSDDMALTLAQKAIRKAYQLDKFVIIGRGGQMVLKDEPGVLHVRIEAPMEDRLQRVKELVRKTENLDNTDIELRRAAQDRIVARDAASADYVRRFYHAEWDDPMLYHLIINTNKVHNEQAVEIITTLVHEMETQTLSMAHA